MKTFLEYEIVMSVKEILLVLLVIFFLYWLISSIDKIRRGMQAWEGAWNPFIRPKGIYRK